MLTDKNQNHPLYQKSKYDYDDDNSHNRLKDLKDKIIGIDLCIKDTNKKLKTYKQGNFSNYPLLQQSSASLSLSPSKTKTQRFELYADPISRPIIETTMKIIDEREKAAKIAYDTFDDIAKKVEKIKVEENQFLQHAIEQYMQETEIEKNKIREEFERILRRIDENLKDKIVQAKMESQQKLEKRIAMLHEDLKSVYVETGIDTISIKKSIQDKIKGISNNTWAIDTNLKDYCSNRTRIDNIHSSLETKQSPTKNYTSKSVSKFQNYTPESNGLANPYSANDKQIDVKLSDIRSSIQNLKSKYSTNPDQETALTYKIMEQSRVSNSKKTLENKETTTQHILDSSVSSSSSSSSSLEQIYSIYLHNKQKENAKEEYIKRRNDIKGGQSTSFTSRMQGVSSTSRKKYNS